MGWVSGTEKVCRSIPNAARVGASGFYLISAMYLICSHEGIYSWQDFELVVFRVEVSLGILRCKGSFSFWPV